ncbi:MAG: branched-chain amino acid ABC transporter permease [Chloroflexota bacterium]|nr:branched-chain amino acid ABC transporter permease [Chloroflexota bacterium]
MAAVGTPLNRTLVRVRKPFSEDRTTAVVATTLSVLALTYPLIDRALNLGALDDLFPIVVYILLALGLNIVVGFAGLLDLGYAAFFAIGAYTVAILTSPSSPVASWLPFELNFWAALILAFFTAAIFGVILGAPTLRLRGDYLAIVTLGFGEIVPIVFRNAVGLTKGDQGLNAIAQPNIFGYELNSSTLWGWWYLLMLVGLLIIFMARRLRDSRLGRAWMAMREDEIAAASMGIDLVKTKLFAFALGASFSGLAGVLFASRYSFANPSQFEFSTSVLLLSMVILGGLGNIWGVIVGGLLLGVFDRILSARATGWIQGLGDATGIELLEKVNLRDSRVGFFGLTLVLMMLLRPEGLLPNAQRKRELEAQATPEGEVRVDETLYDKRGEPL